jgi:hypothetical protein
MKQTVLLLLSLLLLCGCVSGPSEAEQYLEKSRNAMALRRYDVARDTIYALRLRFPEAIAERRQAILLLDSIELQAATDSLDALRTVPQGLSPDALRTHNEEFKRLDMKVKFFQRKLDEDLQR